MRFCAPLLLAAASLAAVDAPLVSVTVPDGARTRERFNASIYGAIWNDPAFAPMREKLLTAMDEPAEDIGFAPSQVFAQFVGASAEVIGVQAGEKKPFPLVRFQLDVGPLSEPIFAAMQKSDGDLTPIMVAGANAAFANATDPEVPAVARFGTRIAGSNIPGEPPAMAPIPGHESDWATTIDFKRLFAQIAPLLKDKELENFNAVRPLLDTYLGVATYEGRIIETGMWERSHLDAPCMWLTPVDRSQIDRFPTTALNALAVGLDGPALWDFTQEILAVAAQQENRTVDELIAEANADMARSGMTHTLPQLIQGLTGTWAFSVTPSAPFPAVSVCTPRSPVIDDLFTYALAQQALTPPEIGSSIMVPLPGMPIPIVIARDARAWLITSDSLFVNDWLTGTGGGFMTSPAAQLALEHGGDGALVLGISDTVATLRTFSPFIGLGMGQMPIDAEIKRTVTTLLQRAVQKAKTGYLVVKPEDEGITMEMQGLLTYSINPAIIAAIAIPNLLESRITANESAAASGLKSGIHPAEVQFQAGAYADGDQDGRGESGFLAEMAGGENPSKVKLSLLSPTFNDVDPVVNGYRFRVYLPSKDGGGTTDRADINVDKAEQWFVAYAWPVDGDSGRRAFALDTRGVVCSTFWSEDDGEPEWHAMYSEEVWGSDAAWQPYRR